MEKKHCLLQQALYFCPVFTLCTVWYSSDESTNNFSSWRLVLSWQLWFSLYIFELHSDWIFCFLLTGSGPLPTTQPSFDLLSTSILFSICFRLGSFWAVLMLQDFRNAGSFGKWIAFFLHWPAFVLYLKDTWLCYLPPLCAVTLQAKILTFRME